eukprot:11562188-Alexandrium_andersonii.AAC.1
MAKAGLPMEIIWAYSAFQETLSIRNVVGEGVGQPYSRPFAVPQGDPWSMLVLALMTTPWLRLLTGQGHIPMLLADDMK